MVRDALDPPLCHHLQPPRFRIPRAVGAPGPFSKEGEQIFCFARLHCNNFELLYFVASISKINLTEGLPCRAAGPRIGCVGGAIRLFQRVFKNLEGLWRAPDEHLFQFELAD
jgi:hypothetical protein